jgi:hypothetical protein
MKPVVLSAIAYATGIRGKTEGCGERGRKDEDKYLNAHNLLRANERALYRGSPGQQESCARHARLLPGATRERGIRQNRPRQSCSRDHSLVMRKLLVYLNLLLKPFCPSYIAETVRGWPKVVRGSTKHVHRSPTPMRHPGLHACEGRLNGCEGCLNACASRLHGCAGHLHRLPTLLYRCTVRLHRCTGRLHRCTGRLHRCTGRLHRCAGRLHGCAGRLHGCAGRLHGCEGRLHRCEGRLYRCESCLHRCGRLYTGFCRYCLRFRLFRVRISRFRTTSPPFCTGLSARAAELDLPFADSGRFRTSLRSSSSHQRAI